MQKRNVAIQTEIQSCFQKLRKMVIPELKKCTKIKNLFGSKSLLIPAKIKTAPTFFEAQALQWENDSNYNFLKKARNKMQVVNDSAEKNTLLAKTYHNKLTTNPNRRVARNSQWGVVLGVWGQSPQPPEEREPWGGAPGSQKFCIFLQK